MMAGGGDGHGGGSNERSLDLVFGSRKLAASLARSENDVGWLASTSSS
jgi:hypothetical protein